MALASAHPEATPPLVAHDARTVLTPLVLVCALGYFVDIFDLLLFSIVRVPSLVALGVAEADLLRVGVLLLNAQMAGLLVGGLLWGVLGDLRGRRSVLLGSIALYSLATIANAFATSVGAYAALRFIAGVGLAGELGAAVTLVSEILPKETRGYGTAVIAGVGLLGAVAAALVGSMMTWNVAFLVGGALGLVLLLARFAVHESGMYTRSAATGAKRGDLRLLVASPRRLRRYVACILLGLPIWFVIGILVTFSPEFARALGVTGPILAGTAVLFTYLGGAIGDLASGFLSQQWRSRVHAAIAFIALTAAGMFLFLFWRGLSPAAFYLVCFVCGVGIGYWAVFVTNAAEQFGTNLRSTVATTVPNFIRGSVVPLTLAFQALALPFGILRSALVVGTATLLVALLAARTLEEPFGKDLDFVES
ncbi:MAG TPA: MFS transporter [Candidatus Thermoplasmatota archaeon]|nr:MFS transporter [Candidatus Thermoplasmatota archaeon]